MKYESGKNEPTVKMVVLLSQLYKVSYEQIIDNRIDEKILVSANKSDYKMHSLESVCASPSPVYAADNNSTLDLLYIKKIYRTPGGLTGKFYMSDDFDETILQ